MEGASERGGRRRRWQTHTAKLPQHGAQNACAASSQQPAARSLRGEHRGVARSGDWRHTCVQIGAECRSATAERSARTVKAACSQRSRCAQRSSSSASSAAI